MTSSNTGSSNTLSRFGAALDNFSTDDSSSIGIFFMLALIVHLVDIFLIGFQRDMGSAIIMFVAYLALTVIGVMFIFRTGLSSDTWNLATISLIAFGLPFITLFYNPAWLLTVLMCAPVWPLYLFANPGDSKAVEVIGKFYLIIIIILGTWSLISVTAIGSAGITSPAGDMSEAFSIANDFFLGNAKKIVKGILGVPDLVDQKLNQTLGMDYFTGQVEQNENEPLGVYLEDVRAIEELYSPGNPVVVWATLRGKSFEGAIHIENTCYAKLGSEVIRGQVYPEETDLFYDESTTLECEFSGLAPGSYQVYFSSTFLFPTWGYVEYTYVDRETLRSYYSQKKDIHREMDIPQRTQAIYTNGPAAIGMNAVDMPIAVDSDEGRVPSFGVTLSNAWPQGKINYVDTLSVRVPEGISFESCIPQYENIDYEENLKVYNFRVKSPQEFFTTVTCRTNIDYPPNFFAGQEKVVRTFAVEAVYSYSLKESTNIRVG